MSARTEWASRWVSGHRPRRRAGRPDEAAGARAAASAVRQDLRGQAGPALLRVLAGDAGRDLGNGPEAGRGDGLAARLADPVLAGPEALQRLGEAIGPVDEETPHRERHLAVLADPAGVAGGLSLALVFPGPGIVLEGDRPTQPLQAVDRMLQLLLQCPSDVVHGSALLRPNRVFGCSRIAIGSRGGVPLSRFPAVPDEKSRRGRGLRWPRGGRRAPRRSTG